MPNYSSKHYAEVSRRYAEGTPQEVQALGGEKSAKDYNAEAQALLESTLNDTQITNCITEIPQDIKLELSSGTLTLKAGSKVYLPNGVGVFNVVNIASDLSVSYAFSSTNQYFLFINTSANTIFYQSASSICSGPTDTISGVEHFWYDTTNNLFKRINASGGDTGQRFSLPFVICSANSTDKFKSIDQVFNGFGYIGSTMFTLPGVKGLVPNGRNADGTLKNTKYTVPNVITFERNLTGNGIPTFIRANGTMATSTGLLYDEVNNIVGTGGYFQVGTIDMNAGVISKFQPKTTFRAVDYNDAVKYSNKAEVTGWGLPSNKYIDLTLGPSDSTYTAPANGYMLLTKMTTGAQNIQFFVNGTDKYTCDYMTCMNVSTNGTLASTWIPVKKGDVVTYHYTAGGALTHFRFIYAQGEI